MINLEKLNRKSASPLPPLKRPAPAPYFHPPFFNFSDSPILGGGGPNYASMHVTTELC